MIDIALIIVGTLISIVVGLALAGVFILLRLLWIEYKNKNQWQRQKGVMENITTESGKIIKMEKENPKEILSQELIPPKNKVENTYKEDFYRFNEANKELEKLKKKYEKGDLTYQELKEKFEYYKNQDYYQRILKDHEKK